jgi:hypothetical protein
MDELQWFRNGRRIHVQLLEDMAKDKFRDSSEMNFSPLVHWHSIVTSIESGLDAPNLNFEGTKIDEDDDTYCSWFGKSGIYETDKEILSLMNYFPDIQFYSNNTAELV